jgi:hypothetical protein
MPAVAAELFGPAQLRFTVGVSAADVVLGDFNGDGLADLAVADPASGTVRRLLGDGLGSFNVKAPVEVDGGPQSLAAADFDRDGRTDLVVAGSSTGTISVLLGGGTTPSAVAELGPGPLSLAVGDFDGDGIDDLAIARSATNSVSVFSGDGAGGFGVGREFAVGSRPGSIAAGDFDADGDTDFAVANRGSRFVSLLLGDGAGGFGRRDLVLGFSPTAVVPGDFNGDGLEDLAIAGGRLGALLNDGLGRLIPSSDLVLGASPDELAVGDLDSDGTLDLVAVRGADRSPRILRGDGTGRFRLAANLAAGAPAVAAGDLDRDGAIDLAVAVQVARDHHLRAVTHAKGRGEHKPPKPVAQQDRHGSLRILAWTATTWRGLPRGSGSFWGGRRFGPRSIRPRRLRCPTR